MSDQMRAQVDKLLTNVSSKLDPKGYISEKILPVVLSKQYSGLLGKYGTQHLRIVNSVIGGRGKYRRVEGRAYSTTGYNIEGHGLEGLVTPRDLVNVEAPFDAEKDEATAIATMLWLEKEKALADILGDTSVITQNVTLSGTDQFNDWTNSDPLGVITTGKASVITGCGVEPDTLIMDKLVRNKLRFHPQLLDALGFKYAKPGGLSDDQLAEALEFRRILVADTVYESAGEGLTSALARTWGKNIIMAVCPDTASKEQVALGYMMRMVGGQPRKVRKWPVNNPPDSTAILVDDEYDMLLSNVSAAYLIKNAIL